MGFLARGRELAAPFKALSTTRKSLAGTFKSLAGAFESLAGTFKSLAAASKDPFDRRKTLSSDHEDQVDDKVEFGHQRIRR